MYKVGQGLFGKLIFNDGVYPEYDRAYLVVHVSDEKVGVLDVSSAVGKGNQLLYDSNKYINKHNPPFPKKTFAKLKSLRYVKIENMPKMKILSGGDTLDKAELSNILKELKI